MINRSLEEQTKWPTLEYLGEVEKDIRAPLRDEEADGGSLDRSDRGVARPPILEARLVRPVRPGLERRNGCALHEQRDVEDCVDRHALRGGDNGLRGHHAADARPRERVALGERVRRDRSFGHAWQRGDRDMRGAVGEVGVTLIGEYPEIPLACERREARELFAR